MITWTQSKGFAPIASINRGIPKFLYHCFIKPIQILYQRQFPPITPQFVFGFISRDSYWVSLDFLMRELFFM